MDTNVLDTMIFLKKFVLDFYNSLIVEESGMYLLYTFDHLLKEEKSSVTIQKYLRDSRLF